MSACNFSTHRKQEKMSILNNLKWMIVWMVVVLIMAGCQGAPTGPNPTLTVLSTATSPPTKLSTTTSDPTDAAILSSIATSTDTPTARPSATSSPTDTLVPTPSLDVLSLTAPEAVVELWKSWNGKYVIYAHRDVGIQEIGDLDGMVLFIALINVAMDDVMGDAAAFMNASGVELSFSIQNNVNIYKSQLLEDTAHIGFMIPEVAAEYHLKDNDSLVRLEFEPAD